MYALVDCNSFYASCERIFRPDLRNKPVVVLSNNDGCVIARSNEAKALNIPMGAVAYEYEAIFKQHQVAVFSTNFTLYGDISKRVMRTLQTFTPNLEVYSVDEAFLDLSHIPAEELQEFGKKIHAIISQNIGIPVSVGIASTKTLAKVANHIAKKYPKFQSCFVLKDHQREYILQKTTIDDIWGIGRNYAKMLLALNIQTAYDFTQASTGLLQKKMGVIGKRLQRELLGVSCLSLEEVKSKKNIATTRTFAKNLLSLEDLSTAIANHAANSASKLRQQGSATWQVYVFLKTNSRRPEQAQYRNGIQITLSEASNSSLEIVAAALKGLGLIYKPGFLYKKAGVVLGAIVPFTQVQRTLFAEVDRDKHDKLMKAMDRINQAGGRDTVKLAVQDYQDKSFYRRERLSKQFTTKWTDILEVKV